MRDYEWKGFFVEALKIFRRRVHQHAVEKGFWENTNYPEHAPSANDIAMKLALIHSEVSEALEAVRDGNIGMCCQCHGTDKIVLWHHECPDCDDAGRSKPEGMVAELADAIIRIMDLCEALGLPLEEALILKAEYNECRSHMHGGKAL